MSRSETRLSSLVRSVFSASYDEISRRNCREPKGRRDCHVSSPAARVSTTEKSLQRRTSPDDEMQELEEGKEEVEEANAEDDGVLAEKATPGRADSIVESYLAYTGFTETGRRLSPPKLVLDKMDGGSRADTIEKLPSSGRDTGPPPTEATRTGEPDRQRLVDLQRALNEAPWWGGTLSFHGPSR